ncbi:MAG: glutamate racemase [Lachnospiraceae bacterium]|nr:glutamate racemase [Lachnospiraceae bacterium]
MPDRSAPIGVFDSGVGGLTVAREIMAQIPNERIIYFGDTARVPYGSKSKATITKFTKQIVRFLMTQHVKALVVACNTMSAYAIDEVEKEVSLPVIGVVKPGARIAVSETKNNRIGVIATEGTVGSGMYERFINNIDPGIRVFAKACPLFCPLVEEGMLDDPVTDEIARRYLKELMDKDIDTLIMGCTHYPLLAPALKRLVGESVRLVNPAYETARELKQMLTYKDMLNDSPFDKQEKDHEFYVSDLADKFTHFAADILDDDSIRTSEVDIEKY